MLSFLWIIQNHLRREQLLYNAEYLLHPELQSIDIKGSFKGNKKLYLSGDYTLMDPFLRYSVETCKSEATTPRAHPAQTQCR